ncbi:MAG: alanine racemase [Trueperaceae bacterium]
MPPATPGDAVHDLPTPCLIVDEDRMAANLERAQAYANANGVTLRPHAKTHKSPDLARGQIAVGATGVCVAKLSEAEAFADAGIDDLVMAHTPVGAAAADRAALLARRIRFAVGVDHRRQLLDLDRAGREHGVRIPIRIEVDSGAGRGGMPLEEAPAFAASLADSGGVRLVGLYTYEGFTYAAPDVPSLHERHLAMQRTLVELADRIGDASGERPRTSVGSTPSLLAEVPLLPGIDEIRPGTSIFLDAAQATLAGGLDRCAAQVLATVVSRTGDRAILDAGSKSLASDVRASGVCATDGFGRLTDGETVLTRLSEEHGVIEGPRAHAFAPGDQVRIVPNHVCAAVNLYDHLTLVRGDRVTRVLPVAGRGRRT